MRMKRIIAALAVIVTLTGCSIKPAESSGTSRESQAQTNIAAAPANGDESMTITREDYLGEYLYYIARNGYTTDTDEQTLKEAREQVINSLIEERIIRAEFADSGLTISDSDRENIEQNVDAGIASMKESMMSAAAEADSSVSEDELSSLAEEQYQQILDTCGITRDTFYRWQETLFMKQQLALTLDGAEVSDEELNSQLQALIAAAKAGYEQAPASYNGQDYAGVWIPEGSRYIQALLISFDYDTYSQIVSLRSAGNNDEADALREQSLSGLEERYEEIMSKIVAGEDFAQLMAEHNEDEGNLTLLVTPGTEIFGKDILECAMGIGSIGGTDTAVTDYGYYILRYREDAVVTDETLSTTTENLRSYLLGTKCSDLMTEQLGKWKAEYNYTINYDQLSI